MGPKYASGGEDEHDGKWEYAGTPEFGWKTWKEHGNDKGSGSEFEYEDDLMKDTGKSSHFPDVGYQENPEKE